MLGKNKKSIIESLDGYVVTLNSMTSVQRETLDNMDRAIEKLGQLKMALEKLKGPGVVYERLGKLKAGSEKRGSLHEIFSRVSRGEKRKIRNGGGL